MLLTGALVDFEYTKACSFQNAIPYNSLRVGEVFIDCWQRSDARPDGSVFLDMKPYQSLIEVRSIQVSIHWQNLHFQIADWEGLLSGIAHSRSDVVMALCAKVQLGHHSDCACAGIHLKHWSRAVFVRESVSELVGQLTVAPFIRVVRFEPEHNGVGGKILCDSNVVNRTEKLGHVVVDICHTDQNCRGRREWMRERSVRCRNLKPAKEGEIPQYLYPVVSVGQTLGQWLSET